MNLQSYTNDKTPLQLPACSVIFVLHNAQYEVERRLSPFFSEQLNAELIIIDDASEDGTDNAITSLLEHYEYEPTIYLRNQTRRGIGLCLNDALMQANTPLLYIVDVSVEIDIEAMRRALALLEHSDAAFCVPSGSKYSDFETLRHHLFEQKVPASAAFLLHTERISSEQLFFNPFIKEGHAADLCLRTAAGLPPLEVAPFITGLGGAAGFELSKQLLINLSQQEASVMRFHAANAPVLAQNGTSDAASEDPALLYKRARSLKLDGRITDALHLCDDILYQYPGHDDTEELKIELLQRIKQFVGASELKHQRNMKRREQAKQATSPDPDEEPVPEATSPAEPPLSAAEAPEPQEAGTLSPEPAPDDAASEDTTAAQPMAPEPETEEPVEASASHDADDVNNEILDEENDDDEILIDPRFLPDTDFFDEEEVKEQAAPDHIAPPPAENTFEVAGNTAALPEEPETESPAEAESGPTESAGAGPAVQEESAGSREQTAPEKPADPAVPEPSENMPEPEKKDPEADMPEPQEAGTLSPEPPAEDAASEDTTAAAEAEETREPAEMPEHPPQDAEEPAAAATSDTSAEAAETADSPPEAELSEPPEKEAENEPETSDAPSAAETEEATLKARQEDARGPYKRPMSFYYTIVMPIAGIALEMLEECLLSLEQNCDPDKTELIIIDNACLDETHEYLKQLSSHKFFHLHVITNRTNRGFGRSVNQGIDKALGEYICVMHNDVSLESDLLFELSEILNQHPKVGLVGPKTNNSVNPQQAGQPGDNPLAMEEAMYLDSFCLMMRAEDHYRFSEEYAQAWFDDADLSFQVRQSGKRSVVATGVFVPHHSGGTTEQLGFGLDSELYQKNLAHFNKKWKIDPPMPDLEEAEHPLAEIYELGQLVSAYYPDEKHVARIKELFTPAMESELQRQKNLEDEALIYFIRAMMAIDNRPNLRMLEEQLEGPLDEAYVLELVRYYYQRHIYSRCKKHMKRVKGEPGMWFRLYELRIAYQDKQLERVSELLGELLEAYPAHPEINKIAGDMYQLLGDKAESEAFYSLVNQVDPFHYAGPGEE